MTGSHGTTVAFAQHFANVCTWIKRQKSSFNSLASDFALPSTYLYAAQLLMLICIQILMLFQASSQWGIFTYCAYSFCEINFHVIWTLRVICGNQHINQTFVFVVQFQKFKCQWKYTQENRLCSPSVLFLETVTEYLTLGKK